MSALHTPYDADATITEFEAMKRELEDRGVQAVAVSTNGYLSPGAQEHNSALTRAWESTHVPRDARPVGEYMVAIVGIEPPQPQ